jgi:hypothetical protein
MVFFFIVRFLLVFFFIVRFLPRPLVKLDNTEEAIGADIG